MKKGNIIILVIVLIAIIILAFFGIQKIQQDKRKYEIEQITEYKYFVVRENNLYGVIDRDSNKIIEAQYENIIIPNPQKAVFVCYEENNTKILNENAEQIFTEYENIEPLRLKNISSDLMYEKSILKYSKDGKYGILDLNGKQLTKAIYEEIDTLQFKEGELIVKKDGKYGVINIKGTTLVEINYDQIDTDKYYSEENGYKMAGYIVSLKTDEGYRYGYVNIKGKEIIETKYNDLYRIIEKNCEDAYIICAENGKYGLIKNNKKIIENEYQSILFNESNDTVIALKGKKYGVISIEGDIIVPFEYKQIYVAGEYIYATSSDENVKVFDSEGKETNMSENLSIVKIDNTDYKIYIETIDGKTTYDIYKDQEKITDNKYIYLQYLYDNYFIACDESGKLGIIDDNEKVKIKFGYNSIQRIENTNMVEALNDDTGITEIYSKDMKKICELKDAEIENNQQYIRIYNDEESKYISLEEKEVKNTDIYTNNKIFAKKQGDLWGFVNNSGSLILGYKYEKVTEINEYGFAGIKQQGKWGVINNEGKIIVEPKYELNNDNPIFIGEYYQVVYGNGEIYYTK